jgi:hypothetical protein
MPPPNTVIHSELSKAFTHAVRSISSADEFITEPARLLTPWSQLGVVTIP